MWNAQIRSKEHWWYDCFTIFPPRNTTEPLNIYFCVYFLFIHLQEVMALKNTKIWYPTVLQSWLVRGLRESYSEGRVMSADCESLLNTLAALRANSSRQACLSKTQVTIQFFSMKPSFMRLRIHGTTRLLTWIRATFCCEGSGSASVLPYYVAVGAVFRCGDNMVYSSAVRNGDSRRLRIGWTWSGWSWKERESVYR